MVSILQVARWTLPSLAHSFRLRTHSVHAPEMPCVDQGPLPARTPSHLLRPCAEALSVHGACHPIRPPQPSTSSHHPPSGHRASALSAPSARPLAQAAIPHTRGRQRRLQCIRMLSLRVVVAKEDGLCACGCASFFSACRNS
ncbi:hypothetical protein HYPSUDRAFT_662125 [Hypholoma sublateritium FD-334 SS-4]|uniref:Uncharacterized protein n=1 Tax=Hypholoma sublateritium (strain FD-334 SS-4) TaxID=945553 RepID=A0A0D2L5Z3_HYPSF|nr:hypothetical protein HYPSUDRAFT_662125 [Hypholoma sublateritium FD-334 SS-4]